ncbi:hypothetical protein GCM10010252_60650 [Streptomyces aureoverticillatus]|nr:hypothetical protein GCM10010252_60650 [Streptomyces aureoverticillatus]
MQRSTTIAVFRTTTTVFRATTAVFRATTAALRAAAAMLRTATTAPRTTTAALRTATTAPRTTTTLFQTATAVALVTVAVLALSGCTGVERTTWRSTAADGKEVDGSAVDGSAAADPAIPSPTTSSRPSQAVEAPAHDSLERVGPPGAPFHTAPPPMVAPDTRRSATSASPTTEATPKRTNPARRERPDQPRHRGGHRGRHHGHSDKSTSRHAAPPRTHAHPHTAVELCALGKKHGGWKPHSREAVICVEAYGR